MSGEENNLLLIETLRRQLAEMTAKVIELQGEVRRLHMAVPHTFPGPTTPIIEG